VIYWPFLFLISYYLYWVGWLGWEAPCSKSILDRIFCTSFL